MKLVSYRHAGADRYGAVIGDRICDLSDKFGAKWPSLKAALRQDGLAELAKATVTEAPGLALSQVELLPPITDPDKIICVGLNYRTHIEEGGRDTPTHPMLFARYPDSLVGHRGKMVRPKVSQNYDFEGELAVIIGRLTHHASRERAFDYIAGYACFNDGSVRDYQRHTSQFLPGKTFWRSGAFGPWMVTKDEIADITSSTLTTRLNGEVMQQAPVSDLLFDIPHLIAFVSQIAPLRAGDVIVTGTTGGVGAARKPPVWMKPGDKIEVDISQVGTLTNEIVDEASLPAPAE
jgi:2-keto-4-pentenoate hydratase/2-oxohepta-3-ene-1,7-dioic acid hydratase in catechol pathway